MFLMFWRLSLEERTTSRHWIVSVKYNFTVSISVTSYGWRQTVSWLSLHLLQSPGTAIGEGICRIVCRDWMWRHSATQWPGFYAFGAGIHRTIVDELDPILIIRISAPPTLRDVNKHIKRWQKKITSCTFLCRSLIKQGRIWVPIRSFAPLQFSQWSF